MSLGFRPLGFKVWDLGLRVLGLGAQGLRLLGFKV